LRIDLRKAKGLFFNDFKENDSISNNILSKNSGEKL
jgi:hypothetical protein